MKKIGKYITLAILLVLAAVIIINITVIASSQKYITDVEKLDKDGDYVVVFGCGYLDEETPTKLLRDRIITGMKASKETGIKIMFTGDSEEAEIHDEVKVMKNYAYKIDPSLTIEGDVYGLSTYDSLWRLKNIYGARKVIVVTQKFHLSRAIYIAKGLGLEASGIASDNDDYGPSMFWYQIRETVARCKDFFQVIIKPKAQYY